MSKKNIAKLLMIAAASAVTVNGYAYDSKLAAVNLSHEMAECAAYYLLYSTAPRLDKDTSDKLYERYVALGEASLALSNKDVFTARLELATKTMMREMKSSWSNMSIINNKYGYPCIDLVEDPEARLNYWLEKED